MTSPTSVRERIFGAKKRRYRKSRIVVDGEVLEVGLRSLTEAERTKFEMVRESANNPAETKSAVASQRRRLIVLMTMELDANGGFTDTPVFKETDVIDLESVDSGITAPLFNDCLEHAFITRADIEELVGNSVATAGDS